jgi:5-methylcytosine-specific restriction endonuclease McrA
MIFDSCSICGQHTHRIEGILTNGGVYHYSCYKKLLNDISENQKRISNLDFELLPILKKIESSNSLLTKIKVIFSGTPLNTSKLEARKMELESNIKITSEKSVKSNRKLEQLYDYWPNYPPDWQERRMSKLSTTGMCEKCGKSGKQLHVHHIIRIGNGGSHGLSNLMVLCEKCHQNKHGGKKFLYSKNVSSYEETLIIESSFSKRLKNIKGAISQNSSIRFSYRKFSGEKSLRTIKPTHLEEFKGTLCIHGWCYLRNAKRVFAVKRMRRLSTVTNISGKNITPKKIKARVDKNRNTITKKVKAKKKVKIKKKVKTSLSKRTLKIENSIQSKKSQQEDMIEQLEQHDFENLKLMNVDIQNK